MQFFQTPHLQFGFQWQIWSPGRDNTEHAIRAICISQKTPPEPQDITQLHAELYYLWYSFHTQSWYHSLLPMNRCSLIIPLLPPTFDAAVLTCLKCIIKHRFSKLNEVDELKLASFGCHKNGWKCPQSRDFKWGLPFGCLLMWMNVICHVWYKCQPWTYLWFAETTNWLQPGDWAE